MIHQKKGELELKYIILLILAIIVLITLAVIFRQQLSNFLEQITSISTDINKSRPPIKDVIGG